MDGCMDVRVWMYGSTHAPLPLTVWPGVDPTLSVVDLPNRSIAARLFSQVLDSPETGKMGLDAGLVCT